MSKCLYRERCVDKLRRKPEGRNSRYRPFPQHPPLFARPCVRKFRDNSRVRVCENVRVISDQLDAHWPFKLSIFDHYFSEFIALDKC